MTSREATIYHLKQLKGQPLKQQLSYILSNFWIPIVAVLAGILFLVSLIVHWTTQKTPALTLCCIDSISNEEATDKYLREFAQMQGIDAEKHPITVQRMYFDFDAETNYMYLQSFFAMQMAGDLDVFLAEHDTLVSYAYDGIFCDLSQVLTDAQLEELAPSLLYMDLSVLENRDTTATEAPVYPDPTKPEEMEQPIPVAIKLQPDWEFSQTCYPNTYQKSAVALFVNGSNMTNAQAFIQYILQG